MTTGRTMTFKNCISDKARLTAALFAICVITPLVCNDRAVAGPKPENTRPAQKAVIEKLFKGNSWRWSHGGSYHAPDGTMIGKWIANSNRKGHYLDVIGHGRWSVSANGTLCHDAEWRWRRNGELRKRFVNDCWQHVRDDKGNLWQHDQRHGWYRFPKHQLRSGDRLSNRYNRISRINDLW